MYDEDTAQEIAHKSVTSPITSFELISAETDLSALNLNWRERDLPEKLRTKHVHRLHPYMGKFIPQIVEIFLRKFQPKLVYDPFCGSGTTLVEASVLGVDCIGTDISAFNAMISRVKTDSYDLSKLSSECHNILKHLPDTPGRATESATELIVDKHEPNLPVSLEESVSDYIKMWFAERSRNELIHFRQQIENYYYKEFFRIVLSRSARSARLVKHFDLDFPKHPQTEPYECLKHGRICEPVKEARKFLIRYTEDAYNRVADYSRLKTTAQVEVIHGDSRSVSLPKGIELVITSPPYIGLIDYHEQHRYAYELLELEDKGSLEIGAASKGSSQMARKEYISSMNEVFLHTRDHMVNDGVLAIVVHDKYNLYDPTQVGFESFGRLERHVNRRTGRRSGAFHESILLWKKK